MPIVQLTDTTRIGIDICDYKTFIDCIKTGDVAQLRGLNYPIEYFHPRVNPYPQSIPNGHGISSNPIHVACVFKNTAILKCLLEDLRNAVQRPSPISDTVKGINVTNEYIREMINERDTKHTTSPGRTPLSIALAPTHLEYDMAVLLIQEGARPSGANENSISNLISHLQSRIDILQQQVQTLTGQNQSILPRNTNSIGYLVAQSWQSGLGSQPSSTASNVNSTATTNTLNQNLNTGMNFPRNN